MGLFEKAFSFLLEQTWNDGFVNMFMPTDGNFKHKRHREARHRRSIVLDPFERKHSQTVPDMHKPDMNIIQQVERIKNNPSINVPLNIVQLKAVCKKYGISGVSKLEPKKLGNTGIMILWNEPTKTYILKK
jgi:hypothetical protein